MVELWKSIDSTEIRGNENPKLVVNVVEKITNFNKRQKHKGLKILTPKQMLYRLPIVLTQIRAGNTSETLLNQIRQIIYSLYREKKVPKKVHNSIMNPIKL